MTANQRSDLQPIPMLAHETLSVGVDIGKNTHVAGFISTTLLNRHQRFETCPAFSFPNRREGFRSLIDRISASVPLTQVYVVRCRSLAIIIGPCSNTCKNWPFQFTPCMSRSGKRDC